MTIQKFNAWLKQARKNASTVYHVGNLAYDRQNAGDPQHGAVNALGNVVYQAAKLGDVTLVQRRLREGVCAYEAIRQ